MKENMDIVTRSLGVNLFLMRVIGYYPPDKFEIFYKIYKWIFYAFFTCTVPTTTILYLIINRHNLSYDEIIANSVMLSEIGVEMIKLLPFLINNKNVQTTILYLNDPMFNSYSQSQEYIMEECIKTVKFCTNLFLVMCYASLITWPMMPLITHTLPINIWMPFCIFCSNSNYYYAFLIEFLGVCNAATSNGTVDTLISALTCHACAQIRILKHTLQNLGEWADEEIEKEGRSLNDQQKVYVRNNVIHTKIINCIQHHNSIILYVKKIEDTFSFVVFSQFLSSSLVICLCVLQLTLVEPFSVPFFAVIVFTITILSEIYLFCFFGTALYEESISINEALFMGSWYTFDEKSKQLLNILMERSKKPLKVTAGRILDLSLGTFTMIVRRAYSLLAVLRNYN